MLGDERLADLLFAAQSRPSSETRTTPVERAPSKRGPLLWQPRPETLKKWPFVVSETIITTSEESKDLEALRKNL